MMTSIKKEDPLSFLDMKILRACLQTVGAWPTEAFGEKSRRIYLSYFFVMTPIILAFGQVNYLSKNLHTLTFFQMGDYSMIVCLTGLAFVRALLAVMKGYGTILTRFFRSFHLIHFKHKGEYYEKIYKRIDFLSHYFVWFILFIMVMGFVFFNYNATYDNYSNGAFSDEPTAENYTLQFSINYIYPGFNPENYLLTTSFINLFLSYVTSILICAIDSLLYLMAFHLYGHIKVLKYDLQHMARPKRTFIIPHRCCRDQNIKTNLVIEKYDTEENSIIREKIVEYVKHYELIVSFAGDVLRFFGPMVAFNYLYQLLGCGVLLLQLSYMDPQALARYGPVAIITFGQLIEISIIFEIVRAESMKLKDAAYEMPWECMNISNQKLVCMFLCRIQVPIRFTALGMVDIGVQTMTWILKTTLSYFALLKSMNT